MKRNETSPVKQRITRLSIIAGVTLVLCGALVLMFQVNKHSQTPDEAELIVLAQEAANQHAYKRVIELLEQPGSPTWTIDAIQDNPEMLELYVNARQNVPLPRGQHLTRITGPLRQIVRLDPENSEARKKLFDLLLMLDRETQLAQVTRELADEMPGDAEVQRYHGIARSRLGDHEQALAAFTAAADLDPLHVQTHAAIIQLLKDAGTGVDPMVERSERVLAEYPEDPRAELISALTRLAEGNVIQARELMRSAAGRKPTDEGFVQDLVTWMDRVDLFAESTLYLSKIEDARLDSYVGQEALTRAFEYGDMTGILDRLGDADPNRLPPDLLAFWALALSETGLQQQADRVIDELDRRDSAVARAWVLTLPIMLGGDSAPGVFIDRVQALLDAAEHEPAMKAVRTHPYLLQMLGEAYVQIGEPMTAVPLMKIAAQGRYAWARPHAALAKALLETGRNGEAVRHAEMALIRQPSAAHAALHAEAAIAAADPNDAVAVDRAIGLADKVLARTSDQPGLVVAAVRLVVEAGRKKETSQRISAALDTQGSAPAAALAELTELSRQYRLGMEQRILEAIDKPAAGLDVVIAKARALASAGKADEGRALIEQSRPDAPDAAWDTAFAIYLSQTGADDAAAKWMTLADTYPDDINLQLSALHAPGVREDRAFAKRAIERVKQLGGEASVGWKLEQARTLMQGKPAQADLEAAHALLSRAEQDVPDHIEVTLELARCLILMREYEQAEQRIRTVRRSSPSDPELMLMYGHVLHRLQRFNEARLELTAVAINPAAEPALRVNACVMLFEQGDHRVVRQTITSLRKQGYTQTPGLLLLAKSYAAEGLTDKADEMCRLLLDRPEVEAIAFAASYFEKTGRPELAKQAREQARAKGIEQADRLLMDAQAAAARGDEAGAIDLIGRRAEQNPQDAEAWVDAARLALLLNRPAQALRFAQQRLGHSDQHAGLRALVDNKTLINATANDPALAPIAIALLTDPAHRGAAAKALQVVTTKQDDSNTASQLAELAADHDGFQALHELASERLLQAGDTRRAYDLASSAMAGFPDSAASARIASLAAYQMQDWGRLLNAARLWAKRNPADRPRADLMLAAAQSALGSHLRVEQTLAPYITQQADTSGMAATTLDLYTKALVRQGKQDKAWALLKPRINDNQEARLITTRRIEHDLRDQATANRWADALVSIQPGDSSELFERSRALYAAAHRLEDTRLKESSLAVCEQLLSLSGAKPPIVYDLHGQVARDLGKRDKAEASFRKVVALSPQNASVLNNLAMLLADQDGKGLAEAEQLARRATQLSPEDPNLLDTLAIVSLRRDRLEEAARAIERAIRLEPSNPAWRLTHADILEAKGDKQAAQDLRERYAPRLSQEHATH